MVMGWLIGIVVGVLVLGFLFRSVITGMIVSPREGGIHYLSDMLLKQHGLPHGTIPTAILGKVVDMELEMADSAGHQGSLATKEYLVAKTPQYAQLLSEWYEGAPRLEDTWKSIFTEIGVPRRRGGK
jgi:hypothetical protein